MGRKSKNQANNGDANNGAAEQDDFGDQPTSTPTTTVAPSDPRKFRFKIYFKTAAKSFEHYISYISFPFNSQVKC